MPALSRLFDAVPGPVLFRALAWQYRLFEPELARLRELTGTGGTAIDVGGWWGPWTYWLSRTADHVHTFEPIPHLARFITSNAPPNVVVHEVALSDGPGTAQLFVPSSGKGSEGLSSLHSPSTANAAPIDVELATVDSLELTDVRFVKIDVEGHETAVLRGAAETIRTSRPRLLIEIESRPDRPVTEVFEQIIQLGYTGRFLRQRRWCPLSEFDVERDQLRHLAGVRNRGYIANLFLGRSYLNNFVFDPL